MIDLLKTLIDWEAQPRRAVESGTTIIASGEPTGLIFCLEAGQARDGDGLAYGAGDLLLVCEALALDAYHTAVEATAACQLVAIRQEVLEAGLKRGGRLVWPLSRSIASDITRRRLTG
ncbi:MAG: hypothetical protein VXW25_06790 [Pseudomonadota bacterium]|nr:hypothetical protein [Pseudomonadota bacterium]